MSFPSVISLFQRRGASSRLAESHESNPSQLHNSATASLPSSKQGGTTRRTAEYLDPATLMRIKSLELRARSVVEGFQAGLNRSPYHGFSVEFTEYRQYSPGDDPRYLDWRLYARSDRYYIKRFEDETNLRCHIVLDHSRSMGFGSLPFSKAEYARTLAATLAYFLAAQRDAVGLCTFADGIQEFVPARYRAGHLRRLMVALEKPLAGTATDVEAPLQRIAQQISKRGMLVLISDLLTVGEEFGRNLSYLRARGHEVVVFHVMDPAELELLFEEPALFHDMESGQEVYVDPESARVRYRRNLEAHLTMIREACDGIGATYHLFATGTPLELGLSEFLRTRMLGKRRPAVRRSTGSRRAA